MSYKPPTSLRVKKEDTEPLPLITRQAFELKAAEKKKVTGYVAPSQRQAETPTSFDEVFPELATPTIPTVNVKSCSAWSSGKTFTEKLKDASLKSEVNTIESIPANPRYRVRVVDMPNPPGGEMEDDHPTIKFLEHIHTLRAARFERDRLKALELKRLQEEEDGELESGEEYDDYEDSLSDLYPEPDDSDDDGNYVDDD
jgi:hypothetical protein